MAKTYNEIPTLTQIVHTGDEDMLNHFDGNKLSNKEPGKTGKDNNKAPVGVENATHIENTAIDVLDLNEIPSITTHAKTTELPKHDFTDAMQTGNKQAKHKTTKNNDATKKELKAKIDQAISEALPGIEAQLKGKLYSKFGV